MNLKGRLSRLAGPGSSNAPARSEPALLDDLRAKLAGLSQGEHAEAPESEHARGERVAAELAAFGFERIETRSGWVQRRILELGPSHRVGSTPLELDCDAEVLSLLGLDPELATVDFRRALLLDTETTGFVGAGTLAFLVGCASCSERGLRIEQYLLEGPEHEPALLEELAHAVEQASVLVTFNGKSFDWPLLLGRRVMNKQPALAARPHLDLLHLARRVHGHRLTRCSLQELEREVLGFGREGDLDGAECAARYLHYLRSGRTEGLVQVVVHNELDLISTAALLGLYGRADLRLGDLDGLGLAKTYRRARALTRAKQAASSALASPHSALAMRIRGEIHRALGDRLAALADFEAASRSLDDPGLRLQLAKLYEHFCRQPSRALEQLAQGTGEDSDAAARRHARLRRKLEGR